MLRVEVAAEFARLTPSPWREMHRLPRYEIRAQWNRFTRTKHSAALPEVPQVYRYSKVASEERCRGLTTCGYQCVRSRFDCRENHGGRTVDGIYDEYRAGLARLVEADDVDGLNEEESQLQEKLAGFDAKYSAARESGIALDAADVYESTTLRTKLDLVRGAMTRWRRQSDSYGTCPANWPEDDE